MRRLWLLLLVLPFAAAVLVAADWWICLPEDAEARYVGRGECVECHQEACDAWKGSDHDRAMDPATPEFVLGDFNDRTFTHFGTTSTLSRRGEKFYAATDGPDGAMQTFEIKHVFGYRPLQQYLVEFPDGRVQCLPIAWDTEQKRWFHLYPNEAIPHTDVLHWTRPLQNWNYMCAECHSTDLQKNYDQAANRYHTTWSEIDVSCETCHGPGSLHVELSRSRGFFWDRRRGFGLPKLGVEDSRVEIETCAPCHSRRRVVYPGFRPGQKYLDYYVPELIDTELYYADGQILDEDYVYGSFLQSKMYGKGIRCTDCHDPHSVRVKSLDPAAPWNKITNNRVCIECHMGTHPAAKYDTPQHHHHPDASKPGTLCVECHMPETTYMVADPRRDHSIRSPRPDLTVSLGIPNACNGCHHDESKGETPEWAEQKLREWYGPRSEPPHFAYAIAAGRQGKPEGERELEAVTRRKDLSAMVRASAISLLSRYASASSFSAALRGLEDPEGLVRVASVRSLQNLPVEAALQRLAPMLGDPLRAVRTEAARILSRAPRQLFSEKDLKTFDAALAEYVTGLQNLADQPAAHLNLAVVYADLGEIDKAESEYLTALRIDDRFVPARINYAMLLNQQGRKDAAAEHLRRAIELEPDLAEARYSLGLLLAEDEKQLAEAAEMLGKAAELAPNNARMHYNHGLALQTLGRMDEAEQALAEAYKLEPGQNDYLHALAILYVQQERWPRAAACAEELLRRRPDDARFRALAEFIRRQGA